MRDGLVLVLAVVVGVAITGFLRDRVAVDRGPGLDLPQSGSSALTAETLRDDTPVVPAGDATTPEAAVAGFLAAEAARDFATSYTYLSAADRAEHPSPTRWIAAHAQQLPITGYRLTGTEERRRETFVLTDLTLSSALDPVLGLVPARATADIPTVEENGGWRVAFQGVTVTPVLPDDADAVTAARAWAEAAARCETPATVVAPLYGRGDLAKALCESDGALVLGDPGRLTSNGDANDLIAAFGPETIGWARVVPVTSPTRLGVVLAPVDDVWQVVGLIRSR